MIELVEEELPQPTEKETDIRFDDNGFPLLAPPPSGKKMGRPRKYDEDHPPPPRESRAKLSGVVTTETILKEIQKVREENPTKKQREIHSIFMESKRDWILAKLFDTAENGDTPTIRFNAQSRLKDELDGRVATQDKRDPDEDDAITKIAIPEEM